jgi:hypothetical protein
MCEGWDDYAIADDYADPVLAAELAEDEKLDGP